MVTLTQGRPRVGILVHGGAGSWTRVHALLRHLRADVTVLSTQPSPLPFGDAVRTVALPLPSPRPNPLVASPVSAGLGAAPAAALAAWIDAERPDLLVVDGVPDAAVLARIAGVPVVPIRRFARQDGDGVAGLRQAAAAWLAPYPAVLEPEDTPAEVRVRTVHAGFLSRFEGRRVAQSATRRRLGIDRDARHATIVTGGDDLEVTRAQMRAISAVCRTWSFTVVGPCPSGGDVEPPTESEGLEFIGWTDDPFPYLVAADVVVCGASLGVVADVAAALRPFAVVTRAEEGDASSRLGAALEAAGLATVFDRWPGATAWPALLAELLDLDTRALRRVSEGRASKRAADWIAGWALTPPRDPAAEAMREPTPAVLRLVDGGLTGVADVSAPDALDGLDAVEEVVVDDRLAAAARPGAHRATDPIVVDTAVEESPAGH